MWCTDWGGMFRLNLFHMSLLVLCGICPPAAGSEGAHCAGLRLSGRKTVETVKTALSLRGGGGRMLQLEALHKDLLETQRLACVGSTRELGCWNVDGARELKKNGKSGVWSTSLQVPEGTDLQYKYVVLNNPEYEKHVEGNRVLEITPDAPGSFTVVDVFDGVVRSLTGISSSGDSASSGVGTCRFELMLEEGQDVSQIQVVGAHPSLGGWREGDGIPMERESSNLWVATAKLPMDVQIEYKIVVWNTARRDMEGERKRAVYIPADGNKMLISDSIGEISVTEPAIKRALDTPGSHSALKTSCLCQFDVSVEGAPEGTSVSLVGSHEYLGEWQMARAVPMFQKHDGVYSVSIHLPVDEAVEYKYVVKSEATWEEGVPRKVTLSGDLTVTRDSLHDRISRQKHEHNHEETHELEPSTLMAVPKLSVAADYSRGFSGGGHGRTSLCTFRLENLRVDVLDGQWLAIAGDTAALGDWDLSRCLPMKAHEEAGGLVFTATAHVDMGSELNYKYVILRSPKWEERIDNRIFSAPTSASEWLEGRRDNVRLVRRVRDVVGTAETLDSSDVRDAFLSVAAQADVGAAREEVEEGFFEAVDSALLSSCLYKVDVEVQGLSPDDRVWMCGADEALGAWEEGKGMELTCLPALRVGNEVSSSPSSIWSGLVRLPADKMMEYKYCVAQKGSGRMCWEIGSDRLLTTPPQGRGSVFDRFKSPLGVHPCSTVSEVPVNMGSDATTKCNTMQQEDATKTCNNIDQLYQAVSAQAYDAVQLKKPEAMEAMRAEDDAPKISMHATDDTEDDVPRNGWPSAIVTVEFEVEVSGLASDEKMYVLGSSLELGAWKQNHAVMLEHVGGGRWRREVVLAAGVHVKYKYIVRDYESFRWESGLDRALNTPNDSQSLHVQDVMAFSHTQLDYVSMWKQRAISMAPDDFEGGDVKTHENANAHTFHEPRANTYETTHQDHLSHQEHHNHNAPAVVNGVAAELLEETDVFLSEFAPQAESNGTPFKHVVRNNRWLLQRCQSVLDKTVDDYTREQVVLRMRALDMRYHSSSTISHTTTQESLFSTPLKMAGGQSMWQGSPSYSSIPMNEEDDEAEQQERLTTAGRSGKKRSERSVYHPSHLSNNGQTISYIGRVWGADSGRSLPSDMSIATID